MAAALIAAPASAESIRIPLAGKTPHQVNVEVYKAANKLCREMNAGASFPIDAQHVCVMNTVHATMAQLKAPMKVAER
ncbi:hypothetical protein DJ021_00520 [Phenylobacterium hankyongense]|uniref:UrcA family protein n=1 Tax=Phenylobacterium hankyongense TaxID=1813876 RepID=A0A328AUU0_9CAUL|nr:hypothetical protein DJ021_00520 [Phenylobacterium hankyongense]